MASGRSITWLVPQPASWRTRISLNLLCRQAWHPDHSAGSVWIRSFQVAPYLEQAGYRVRCNQLSPLPDVAVFLRRHSAADLELARKLKAQGVKVVVEVVVNYFETRPDVQSGYGASPPERTRVFHELVALADQVWTVSPFLAELAKELNPNSFFVSDSVDPQHFIPKALDRQPAAGPLTIGWSGVASKSHVLDELAPLLRPWLDRGKARLLLVADKPVRLASGLPFEYHRWRYQSFPDYLQRCALCIAPRLVDNDYDRGHSLFKIGVFMAVGVPAIAGPVPSYDLLLADGQAGAICHTLEDWQIQLERFLSDPDVRRQAGLQAQQHMQPYLTPQIAARIQQCLEQL